MGEKSINYGPKVVVGGIVVVVGGTYPQSGEFAVINAS